MTRLSTNCLFALALCCLPVLAGCVDQEKKKALADLKTTETALASLKAKTADLEKELAQKTAQIKSLQEKIDELQKKLDAALKPPAKPTP